jgi:hypothetical protein
MSSMIGTLGQCFRKTLWANFSRSQNATVFHPHRSAAIANPPMPLNKSK